MNGIPASAGAAASAPPFYGTSWQKLMMWMFVVTDGLLFAGFLASYLFCRLASDRAWPDRAQVFDIDFIAAMTFVLITSSATMASAVRAAHLADHRRVRLFLALTILGGLGFLGMQAWEWSHFLGDGARLASNPWGVPGFAGYFFTITGFHGTHVLIGVIVLLLTLRGQAGPILRADRVELAGLYWHFVDLVWVFVFGCFYLL